MGSPYIGELRLFAGSFAPVNWHFCDGTLLAISENPVLFQLIGTTYGGDGQSNFALPDLRGRVPIHMGNNQGTLFTIGERAGTENVTLTSQQLPTHSHSFTATTNTAAQSAPAGQYLSTTTAGTVTPYGVANPTTTLDPRSLQSVGGSLPHENRQPFLCVSFIIALAGIFPTQN